MILKLLKKEDDEETRFAMTLKSPITIRDKHDENYPSMTYFEV